MINEDTGLVTMTLVGPDNVWLSASPGSTMMNQTGNDVVIYEENGLSDRHLTGSYTEPNADAAQDWTVESNTTADGVRTLVATRAIDTGDANDFTFPTSQSTFPLIWAKGSRLSLAVHESKGTTEVNTTSGLTQIDIHKMDISFYPNPAKDFLTIKSEKFSELDLTVYSIKGDQVLVKDY